jgi:alkyl sulfatase BDS1-like metallo-beta-lactamase superfamily hydrolase
LSNLEGYSNYTLPAGEIQWLTNNYNWMKDMAQKKTVDPVYWTQVELVLSQLEGMVILILILIFIFYFFIFFL